MHTLDHLDTMGNIFVGLQNLLNLASARDLEMIGAILYEYSNQGCNGEPNSQRFPGILMEIGSLYADAAIVDQPSIKYEASFRDEGRLAFVLAAAEYSRDLTNGQVAFLFSTLIDAREKLKAEEEKEGKGAAKPQVVKPAPKSRSRKAA